MNPYLKTFLKIFFITSLLVIVLSGIITVGAVFGLLGNNDDLGLDAFTMDYSSQIYYEDSETGEMKEFVNLSSVENRVWVDIENIPKSLRDAIVSIEDERFYEHSGFDLKRTTKAFFAHVYNKITGKPTTFGGSTITQQLIKNLTKEKDKTAARKIKEISRAVNLEKQMEKEDILELYLNSIYLSQGCNGVQTASKTFFGKDVSELNLAECASIAGITQYPTLYDPLINPEKNKEKQEIVLKKMLELEKISKEEYDEAVKFELVFNKGAEAVGNSGRINSYFVDQVITEVKADLMKKGYTEAIAEKLLYSGGLKIYSTYDPKVQSAIEKVYTNNANFPGSGGEKGAQSAMVVIDPYTGGIKGIVGGVGVKAGNLILNRASQTVRQPGSTIKPIAVYAPAIENGVINAADIYYDKPLEYGEWKPQNYDRKFRGPVSVRYALKQSLNTIPVQILEELGVDKSFSFLNNRLGFTSLVRSEKRADGKVYSDIGLSQLALGGLTDGMSLVELAASYTPFVNRGMYSSPSVYTTVEDAEGNVILSKSDNTKVAFSEETAYITAQMLREVVTGGTGASAGFSPNIFTGGKTGTTSDNKDRWFVGFTPYYVTAAWYGYDEQRTIPASGNPCIPVWKKVMAEIHSGLPAKNLAKPSDVISVSYCSVTGKLKGEACPEEDITSFWFTKNNRPVSVCSGSHVAESEEGITSIEIPEGETSGGDTSGEQTPDTPQTENTDSDVTNISVN